MIRMTIRSPRPPGHTNHPPPLEYPTATQPENPAAEMQEASRVQIPRNTTGVERLRFGLGMSAPSGSPRKAGLGCFLHFRDQRADRIGNRLSCNRHQAFTAPIHKICGHKAGYHRCQENHSSHHTLTFNPFVSRHIPPQLANLLAVGCTFCVPGTARPSVSEATFHRP
jgi:hypothetical protein